VWLLVPAAYMQFHLLGLPLMAVAVAQVLHIPVLRIRQLPLLACLLLAPNAYWFYLQQFSDPLTSVTRAKQIEAIDRLAAAVPKTARVQDGFTGVGCLHQRADYWWWINEHSMKLLERLEEFKDVRARWRRNPPDAYLMDADLKRALEPMENQVTRDYDVVERNDASKYFLLKRK
jgi:hypothetical protein